MELKVQGLRQVASLIDSRKMGTALIQLTPQLAELLLARNLSNRPVKRNTVLQYAKDIKEDEFSVTGDTIKISKTGRLLDGQHRCLAVIESNKTINTLLAYGIDEDVFDKIDTGRVRMASDVLSIKGFDNPIRMAALVKFVINFKAGAYHEAGRNYSRGNKRVTNTDVLDFANANAESLNDSYYYGYNKDNKIINGTQLAGLHYIFKALSREAANTFCKSLADGVNLEKTSPIYILRKKLIEDNRAKRKMDVVEKIGLICKAWNYYRKNKKIVRFTFDFPNDEFPKPI